MGKGIWLGALIAAATLLFLFAPIPSGYTYARGDLIAPIFVQDAYGGPASWMVSLIRCEGGVPAAGGPHIVTNTVDSQLCLSRSPAASDPFDPAVHPVLAWEVAGIRVRGKWGPLMEIMPLWPGAAPTYTVEVDFRVTYADGQTSLLRWRTWRYGVTLGPIVIDMRRGPAGDIWIASEGRDG